MVFQLFYKESKTNSGKIATALYCFCLLVIVALVAGCMGKYTTDTNADCGGQVFLASVVENPILTNSSDLRTARHLASHDNEVFGVWEAPGLCEYFAGDWNALKTDGNDVFFFHFGLFVDEKAATEFAAAFGQNVLNEVGIAQQDSESTFSLLSRSRCIVGYIEGISVSLVEEFYSEVHEVFAQQYC